MHERMENARDLIDSLEAMLADLREELLLIGDDLDEEPEDENADEEEEEEAPAPRRRRK